MKNNISLSLLFVSSRKSLRSSVSHSHVFMLGAPAAFAFSAARKSERRHCSFGFWQQHSPGENLRSRRRRDREAGREEAAKSEEATATTSTHTHSRSSCGWRLRGCCESFSQTELSSDKRPSVQYTHNVTDLFLQHHQV